MNLLAPREQQVRQASGEWCFRWLDESFVLYEHDGKMFGYETGKFRLRRIKVDADGNVSESNIFDRSPAMFGAVESTRQMTKN